MSQPASVKPFNQHVRIWGLRALFALVVLPLIVLTRSAWDRQGLVFGLMDILGIFAIVAAVIGRFWAILYIGGHKNRTVMQDGPYSICRHPLYLSSTVGAVGLGLLLGSVVLTAIIGGMTFVALSATAAREEAFLRATFGQAYDDYAARVPRIWPKPALFTTEATVVGVISTIKFTLRDAFVFLGFIPLARLLNAAHDAGWLGWVALY
jgi:protein-S-isoprenylcysteine O-methyltransferase Ste14